MALTKLFIVFAITGLLFTTSCGGGTDSKVADMWCEMIKLEKERKETDDAAKKKELKTKIKTMWKEIEALDKEMKEKYKDDKKGKVEAGLENQKLLLDCDALDDKGREDLKEQIEKNEEKLKNME